MDNNLPDASCTGSLRRRLPAPRPLDPFLDHSEAMADASVWRIPSSPVGWDDYHKLIQETIQKELKDNAQRNRIPEGSLPFSCDTEKHPRRVNSNSYLFNNIPDSPVVSSKGGYMAKDSPFSLDMLPPDMSFLEWFPKGTATITYTNDLGDMESITNLSPWIIEERSLLLAQAFEDGLSGPQLHLEPLTTQSARPFLQYLYTSGYSLPTATGEPFHDVPTSLLIHCQLFRLADIYDLPELKRMANVNILRQCEFGCSSPEKPIDLCAAIEYVYKHMREQASVIDTIINYCVTCFLNHGLADDFEFRRLAFDLRPFHQELCKVSMGRQFEDDSTAQAIIQMPFKPYVPETYASREDGFGRGSGSRDDVVWHFHCEDVFDSHTRKRKNPEVKQAPEVGGLMLALRSRREDKKVGEPSIKSEENPSGHKRRSMPPKLKESEEQSKIFVQPSGSASQQVINETVPYIKEEVSFSRDDGSTDSEYEVISGPPAVQILSSDSESDAETLVVVEAALPIRNRSAGSSTTAVEQRDSSDSEWDMV